MSECLSLILNLTYLVAPFALVLWLKRSSQSGWKIFGRGVFFFILAQIPFAAAYYGLGQLFFFGNKSLPFPTAVNWLLYVFAIASASSLSLESMRWLGLRSSGEKGVLFNGAMTFVAGFGGATLFLNGLGGILIMLSMMIVKSISIQPGAKTTLPFVGYDLTYTGVTSTVSASAYWAEKVMPWLTSTLETITPFMLHVGVSVLIWLSLREKKVLWYFAAVFWHFIVYGIFVFVDGFVFIPMAVQKITLPAFAAPSVMLLLILMNIVLFAWGYRRATAFQSYSKEQISPQDPV
jgi:uncharacterized membrane protein YhfC